MDEEYVERVLSCVERIPPGRVMAYGWIAEVVGGGPRQVARVLAGFGGGVPWWRVVTATGRLPPGLEVQAREHLVAEGVQFTGPSVSMATYGWWPPA